MENSRMMEFFTLVRYIYSLFEQKGLLYKVDKIIIV